MAPAIRIFTRVALEDIACHMFRAKRFRLHTGPISAAAWWKETAEERAEAMEEIRSAIQRGASGADIRAAYLETEHKQTSLRLDAEAARRKAEREAFRERDHQMFAEKTRHFIPVCRIASREDFGAYKVCTRPSQSPTHPGVTIAREGKRWVILWHGALLFEGAWAYKLKTVMQFCIWLRHYAKTDPSPEAMIESLRTPVLYLLAHQTLDGLQEAEAREMKACPDSGEPEWVEWIMEDELVA